MDRKETNMTEPNPWQAPEQPVPAPALPQAGEEQPVTAEPPHKQGDTMKHRILGMATALITAMMLIGGGGRNSRSRNTH